MVSEVVALPSEQGVGSRIRARAADPGRRLPEHTGHRYKSKGEMKSLLKMTMMEAKLFLANNRRFTLVSHHDAVPVWEYLW
jgi:hypothetical protein